MNGLFTVEDRPGRFRLIFDKRPSNAGERNLEWLSLPMGSMFARVRLDDASELRASGSYRDSYFNRLRQHPKALASSAFGRQSSAGEAARLGFLFRNLLGWQWQLQGWEARTIQPYLSLRIFMCYNVGEWMFPACCVGAGRCRLRGCLLVFYDDIVVASVVPRSLAFSQYGTDREIM